jgi:tetratricopeptide (TPR) repeat protein
VRVQLSTAIVAIAILSILCLGSAWSQTPQEPAQQQPAQPATSAAPAQQTPPAQAQPETPKQPQWKDRQEYDLVESIRKETDPNKKLELLNQWKEKYPTTDFKVMRLEVYIETYQALKDPAKMLETAKELLTVDPKNLKALYWTSVLIVSLNPTAPSPDALDLAAKTANGLLTAEKPAQTSEEQWKQSQPEMQAIGHRTLGWVAMQRKDWPEAEKQFKAELQNNQRDAQASYWLGTAILAQKKPEQQSEALYAFARAASYDGPGALDPAGRKQIENYVQKAYNTFHGEDPDGFQKLMALAKTSALPPADFKIASKEEIKAQKEAELEKTNPALAFWLRLKAALSAPDGVQYFETGMKDAMVPPEDQPAFSGTVISGRPILRPTQVVVGVDKPDVGEVTLKLDGPLPGRVEPGTVIKFRGVAVAFTQTPFMLTFSTEVKNVEGWPKPAPPAKKAPVHRKKK